MHHGSLATGLTTFGRVGHRREFATLDNLSLLMLQLLLGPMHLLSSLTFKFRSDDIVFHAHLRNHRVRLLDLHVKRRDVLPCRGVQIVLRFWKFLFGFNGDFLVLLDLRNLRQGSRDGS